MISFYKTINAFFLKKKIIYFFSGLLNIGIYNQEFNAKLSPHCCCFCYFKLTDNRFIYLFIYLFCFTCLKLFAGYKCW